MAQKNPSLRCILSFLLLLVINTVVAAKESDVVLHADMGLGLNPQGVGLRAGGYWRQTYNNSDSLLWNDLYLQGGVQAAITPAFSQGGIHLEWLPIAVMQLRLQYDRLYFSGSHGSLLGFNSAEVPFSDTVLERRKGEERSEYGKRTLAQVTLRLPLGHMLLLNQSGYHHYSFPEGAPYYLEREHEILLAADDHLMTNSLTLLYPLSGKIGSKGLLVGPFHEYYKGDKSGLRQEKVGLLWYREMGANWFGTLERPRTYLKLGYYLQDRNREDQFMLLLGVGADLRP